MSLKTKTHREVGICQSNKAYRVQLYRRHILLKVNKTVYMPLILHIVFYVVNIKTKNPPRGGHLLEH